METEFPSQITKMSPPLWEMVDKYTMWGSDVSCIPETLKYSNQKLIH